MSEVLKDPRAVKNVVQHSPEQLFFDQEDDLGETNFID